VVSLAVPFVPPREYIQSISVRETPAQTQTFRGEKKPSDRKKLPPPPPKHTHTSTHTYTESPRQTHTHAHTHAHTLTHTSRDWLRLIPARQPAELKHVRALNKGAISLDDSAADR
jgi:hypothetical protein